MPIGNFPAAVQTIIKIIPLSHAASLFRLIIMSEPVETVFNGAPIEIKNAFLEEMGVTFAFDSWTIQPWMQITFLAITAVLFYGVSLLIVKLKKQK